MKRRLGTSWPISIFWVILSVTLALMSTYSFLQADWVIKRSLIITNFDEPFNETESTSLESRAPAPPFTLLGQQQQQFRPTESELLLLDYLRESSSKGQPTEKTHARNESQVRYISGKRVKVSKVVTSVRFGTIGVCTTLSAFVHCQLYDEKNQHHSISSIWAVVTVIGGCGCIILCVSAVLSLMAIALPSSALRHQVATVIGHTQTIAVVLLFLSLLLFPLGFDSEFVRYHCGPLAAPYNIADCEIGWAYALVLVCASLALYCPVLVKFTADIRYDSLPKYL